MDISRATPIQTETIRTACQLAGGASKLARHLQVRAMQLTRWLKGEERPPARVFVHCVDIVLLHERHLGTR
jgi:DNA-binding transcriptional regulator YdaS (Cro superfamily)